MHNYMVVYNRHHQSQEDSYTFRHILNSLQNEDIQSQATYN
jgi:hypothetical protein